MYCIYFVDALKRHTRAQHEHTHTTKFTMMSTYTFCDYASTKTFSINYLTHPKHKNRVSSRPRAACV